MKSQRQVSVIMKSLEVFNDDFHSGCPSVSVITASASSSPSQDFPHPDAESYYVIGQLLIALYL